LSGDSTFPAGRQLGQSRLREGIIMKKAFVAAVLCLPLLAISARADGCGFGFKICIGFNCRISCCGDSCNSCGGAPGCCQAGPWYQYWPYEAHFQSAAPIAYPYWPQRMTLPPANAGAYMQPQYPQAAPAPQPVNYYPSFYQPVGYYYQAPSYWYGR
jgi:hypothetical protein